MFKKILIIIFLMCPLAALAAEAPSDTTRLNLKDALTLARQRHAQIIMADERVQQALARLGEASSNLLPQLKGVVSGSRQTRDLRGQGIALPGDPHIGPFNAFDARIKLTQSIFDPESVSRMNAASKGKQLSIAEQQKIDEDVLALVATLYIDARRANEGLTVAGEFLERDLKQWQNAQTKFQQGTASALDVERAQSIYAQSQFGFSRAQTDETKARLDLCAALGLPFEQKIEYSNDDGIAEHFGEDDVDVAKVVQDHPDLNAAQKELDVRRAERGVESSGRLPKISALADIGPSGESPDHSSTTYTVGVQATVPIWESGNRTNRIKESSSRVRESEANVDDVKRQTQARVLTAIEIVKQAKAAIGQAQAQWTVADTESKLALQKLNMGNGSALDVVDAKAQLAFAVDAKAEAVATYRLAQVNFAHALGRMQDLFSAQ